MRNNQARVERIPAFHAGSIKRYRVYFNRGSEFPQIWSIDEGSIASEINVQGVDILGCPVSSDSDLNKDNTLEPRAWFNVVGHLELKDGRAIFRPIV